jgi:hypothetical protein
VKAAQFLVPEAPAGLSSLSAKVDFRLAADSHARFLPPASEPAEASDSRRARLASRPPARLELPHQDLPARLPAQMATMPAAAQRAALAPERGPLPPPSLAQSRVRSSPLHCSWRLRKPAIRGR